MVHHRTTTKTVARLLRRTAVATMYLGHRRRVAAGASLDVRHKCRVENARRFAGCENKGGYDRPFRVGGVRTLGHAVAIGQRNVESTIHGSNR